MRPRGLRDQASPPHSRNEYLFHTAPRLRLQVPYFSDLVLDVLVIQQLFASHLTRLAALSASFVLLQFFLTYISVKRYLAAQHPDHRFTCLFTWLGFPFGVLAADLFMITQPVSHLLPVVLQEFVPNYVKVRALIEITCEALPQALLQFYIYLFYVNELGAPADAFAP
jgi:hypothetical protein